MRCRAIMLAAAGRGIAGVTRGAGRDRQPAVLAARSLLMQRRLAALFVAAALLLKLIVPAGYMIAVDHGRVAMIVCPGMMPAAPATPASMGGGDAMPGMPPMAAMHHADDAGHEHAPSHVGAEMPCAFAGLSAAALGAIDPVQLVALIVFIMTIGLVVGAAVVPVARPYLRPPLRGPPAIL